MTTRRDTLREPWTGAPSDALPADDATDPGPPPVHETDPGLDPSSSARNRSENEPIDVVFRKIAQREQVVPPCVREVVASAA